MISLDKRINALVELGKHLKQMVITNDDRFQAVKTAAKIQNPWFTDEFIDHAFIQWSEALEVENVLEWVSAYPQLKNEREAKIVGVINAGNIPLVGLHDLLTVILAGHSYVGKNASEDTYLLPFVASLITKAVPDLADRIQFVPKLEEMDAVIATGSNNSARYFEYYFGKYPHIIRMNRNGVAVLNGHETTDELKELGKDIFTYFGLGCRNVSKLYVPEGYNFNKFFESIYDYNYLMNHNKFMNNIDYNNSVLLLKTLPFLQNGFIIIREDERIASPVSIVHYEYYSAKEKLEEHLLQSRNQIQCVVGAENFQSEELKKITVPFGKAQSPQLWDYADGVDTMEFLLRL